MLCNTTWPICILTKVKEYESGHTQEYTLRYAHEQNRTKQKKSGFNTTLFPGGPPPQY